MDGRLACWQDLAREQSWGDLLVGNGLSSHIWPGFGYASLYARACEDDTLAGGDRALFKASATENFESVLGTLAVSIRTLQALGDPAAARLRTRYLRIQATLGMAVRAVHMPLRALPARTRALLRATLRDYECVFTTSYDLLLYWCAGYGASFDGFTDFFFCNERLEFDPAKITVDPGVTRLLYLHGALHLLIDTDGVICKRRSRGASLLAQFGHQHAAETLTRPLLGRVSAPRGMASAGGLVGRAEQPGTHSARASSIQHWMSSGTNRSGPCSPPMRIDGMRPVFAAS